MEENQFNFKGALITIICLFIFAILFYFFFGTLLHSAEAYSGQMIVNKFGQSCQSVTDNHLGTFFTGNYFSEGVYITDIRFRTSNTNASAEDFPDHLVIKLGSTSYGTSTSKVFVDDTHNYTNYAFNYPFPELADNTAYSIYGDPVANWGSCQHDPYANPGPPDYTSAVDVYGLDLENNLDYTIDFNSNWHSEIVAPDPNVDFTHFLLDTQFYGITGTSTDNIWVGVKYYRTDILNPTNYYDESSFFNLSSVNPTSTIEIEKSHNLETGTWKFESWLYKENNGNYTWCAENNSACDYWIATSDTLEANFYATSTPTYSGIEITIPEDLNLDPTWTSASSTCSWNGLFESSTLSDISCYAQEFVTDLIFRPNADSVNYFYNQMKNIKSVFPFKLVNDFTGTIKSAYSNPTTTITSLNFSFDTPENINFEMLGANTLSNVVGTSTKNEIFSALESVIWIATGWLIISLVI